MRGETKVSARTQLEVVTEGVLTRILQNDPELTGYQLVLFDEFHERSLQSDLAFVLTRQVQQALRDDLQSIIMSATLDLQTLKTILPDAPIIESQGRNFPVEIFYRPVQTLKSNTLQYDRFGFEKHVVNVITESLQHSGDILVFLAGSREIKHIYEALKTALNTSVEVHMLYGQLNVKQQQAALSPSVNGHRKIVLSTNIAETSLTIQNVTVVIDTGLQKRIKYDTHSDFTQLITEQIAQASAQQRAGRAGRTHAGVCYRLWSSETQNRLRQNYPAEIEQADLSQLCYQVYLWGEFDIYALDWPTQPKPVQIKQATDKLARLGLIHKITDAKDLTHTSPLNTQTYAITSLGRQIQNQSAHLIAAIVTAKLPHLITAHLFSAWLQDTQNSVSNSHWDCQQILINIARQSNSTIQQQANKTFCSAQLNNLDTDKNSLEKNNLNKRDTKINQSVPKPLEISTALIEQQMSQLNQTLIELLPTQLAKKRIQGALNNNQADCYLMANGRAVELLPNNASLNAPQWLLVLDANFNQSKANGTVRYAIALTWEIIAPLIKSHLTIETRVDTQASTLSFYQKSSLFKLNLGRQRLTQKPAKTEKIQAWLGVIDKQGIQLFKHSNLIQNLIIRWNLAATKLDEFVPISFDELIKNADKWLTYRLGDINSIEQLSQLNVSQLWLQQQDYGLQQLLNQHLPEQYQLPDGRVVKIDYANQAGPKISCFMQSFYGLTEQPNVLKGSVKLICELHSPAKRVIQTTQDLANFWQGSYQMVQKEMKGQYPKHFWPDKPADEAAGTQTKRQRSSQ